VEDVQLEDLLLIKLIFGLRVLLLTLLKLDLLNCCEELTLGRLLLLSQQIIDREVESSQAADVGDVDLQEGEQGVLLAHIARLELVLFEEVLD